MLMQLGVHAVVLPGNGPQFVSRLGSGLSRLFGLWPWLWLCFNGLGGLLTGDGLGIMGLLGLCVSGNISFKRSIELCSAIRAEADAFGQLLAAAVAKPGSSLSLAFVNGCIVPERGIRVISHDEPAVFILAHRKALRAHDLAVVYQQLLFRYCHPFSALWALEFHNLDA